MAMVISDPIVIGQKVIFYCSMHNNIYLCITMGDQAKKCAMFIEVGQHVSFSLVEQTRMILLGDKIYRYIYPKKIKIIL